MAKREIFLSPEVCPKKLSWVGMEWNFWGSWNKRNLKGEGQ